MTVTSDVTGRLSLQPDPLALRQVGAWLDDAIGGLAAAAASDLRARAQLAVHEACMNVIDHSGLPAGGTIELELSLDADRLTVWVRDEGHEFDLPSSPSTRPPSPDDRGYGITIIRALVDTIAYRRLGSVSELELVFEAGRNRG